MEKVYNVTLDVNNNITNNIGEFVSTDIDTCRVNFSIVQNNIPLDLTNKRLIIVVSKTDNTTVIQDVEITNSTEGKATILLHSQCTSAEGYTKAELQILQDSKVYTTGRFAYTVRLGLMSNETLKSTNEYSVLTNMINNTENILTKNTELNTVMSLDENIRKTNEVERVNEFNDIKTTAKNTIQELNNTNNTVKANEDNRILAEQERQTEFANIQNTIKNFKFIDESELTVLRNSTVINPLTNNNYNGGNVVEANTFVSANTVTEQEILLSAEAQVINNNVYTPTFLNLQIRKLIQELK